MSKQLSDEPLGATERLSGHLSAAGLGELIDKAERLTLPPKVRQALQPAGSYSK